MSVLYGNNRTPRTVRRSENYRSSVRSCLFGSALSVLLCAGLAIYLGVYLQDVEIAVLLSVAVVVEIVGTVILLKFNKKSLVRYYSCCTDNALKIVLILPQTRKITRFTCAQIIMYFLEENEETAMRYARTASILLQKGISKQAKKRARLECRAFAKRSRGFVYGGFAPVDLYDLHNKHILLAESVQNFFGEPNRAVLSQNGCELTVFDEKTEQGGKL